MGEQIPKGNELLTQSVGWEEVELGDICEVKSGGTPKRNIEEYWNGDIPWLGSAVCKDKEVYEAKEFITKLGLGKSSAKLFQENTTLIALVGATIGKTALLKFKSTTNQNIASLYPSDNNVLNPIYLFYICQTLYEEFTRLGNFSMANLSFVKNLKIPLPPLHEQKKIAAILTSIDEVIEKAGLQINKLKDLKKATMNELLTKGIVHTVFNTTPLAKLPKGWGRSTIGDCCEILDSKRIPLNSMERANRKGKYPYYGANGVQGYIDDFIFDGDAILLAEDGGNFDQYADRPIAQWVTGKYWVNNHAHILRVKENHLNKWIFYSLVHKNILKFINGGTRAKLNQSDLRDIEILSPPLQEQKEIVDILTSMDVDVEGKQRKLEQIHSLKKAIMKDLLTSKVRI